MKSMTKKLRQQHYSVFLQFLHLQAAAVQALHQTVHPMQVQTQQSLTHQKQSLL